MVTAKKPESPTQALSSAGPDVLMEGKQEISDRGRTRPAALYPNFGTWGDTVYPGCHHTSDPKAPKVTKAM
jgi:hypothetical protein